MNWSRLMWRDTAATDVDLIQRVAQQDHEALVALYDRHSPRVLGVIRRVIRDEHDATEVLQAVMLELWTRHASRYNPVLGSVSSWVCRLARARAIDRVRSNARRAATVELPAEVAGADAVTTAYDDLASQELRIAMASLDAELRSVVMLAYINGLTREQIADHLDVPIGTVKTRLRRAIGALRANLTGSEVIA